MVSSKKGLNILVVDDNIDIIRSLVNHLRTQGWSDVVNAPNGQAAVEITKEIKPDIIVMDWEMPMMSGIEATQALKEDDSTKDIPVIIATGKMTESSDLKIALGAGAVDYIRKPIDFIELDSRIQAALRLRQRNLEIQELLKREIELKSRKLSTASMLIVEKNQMMQKQFEEIQVLRELTEKGENEELARRLRRLSRMVHSQIETDASWENFKLHFDDVHPSFFTRLKKASEELTIKDLKLGAYLRLGIENKEIAKLLNISPESVKKALYRMKLKLGLDQEVNLRSFISGLS